MILHKNCLKWQFFSSYMHKYWLQSGSRNRYVLNFKGEPSSPFGSSLPKLHFLWTFTLFATTYIIFDIQPYEKFLEKNFESVLGTQKGLFTPFLSISIISLYAKHKANLPPISPFLILIYNLHFTSFHPSANPLIQILKFSDKNSKTNW